MLCSVYTKLKKKGTKDKIRSDKLMDGDEKTNVCMFCMFF